MRMLTYQTFPHAQPPSGECGERLSRNLAPASSIADGHRQFPVPFSELVRVLKPASLILQGWPIGSIGNRSGGAHAITPATPEGDMFQLENTLTNEHLIPDAVIEAFLDAANEKSFARLFKVLTPQLLAFFQRRGCKEVAEDLAQEVMFTVYRKAGQLRDRALFRAWVFAIARNALARHWAQCAREAETVDLAEVPERFVASHKQSAGTPAFEFHRWMAFLDSREREALTLRFIEECEYREIAAAQAIPIGTAQSRIFNAKKKLALRLKKIETNATRVAA